jgi:hypothetical protein
MTDRRAAPMVGHALTALGPAGRGSRRSRVVRPWSERTDRETSPNEGWEER